MIEEKKLILIDGNAIVHRAFHAIPIHFKNSKGEILNAVFGFTSMLLNILNLQKPDFIAVSFDLKGKTFRHEEYEEYKATRVKAKEELYQQIPRIKEVVSTFEIPIYEVAGFEADDVLGTLAKQACGEGGIITYIVTGDMDATQLVNGCVKVLAPVKGFKDTLLYDRDEVWKKYNLEPGQITDLKGLMGDTSDNIKGVPGIGPKTAKDLLQKYASLERIYEKLEEIGGTVAKKLKEGEESAFLSKRLATIITDVPVQLEMKACKTHSYDIKKIQELFLELEFNSLMSRLGLLDRYYSAKKFEESGLQKSLF